MVTLGFIQISNEMILAIIIAVGWLTYYLVKKLAPAQKVEVLVCDPTTPEGRPYKGEESYVENRVSYFKPMGRGKKSERIDLQRKYPPQIQYRGASRVLVYLHFFGDGETSSWTKQKEGGVPQEYTFQDINMFAAFNSGLGKDLTASGKADLFKILMGVPIGIVIWMILIKLVPVLA